MASRIPSSPGRRQRRKWTGNGRAHIEVKGTGREFAGRLESCLVRLDGVDWAEFNAIAGRVIVAFDSGQADVTDLVAVVEAVEADHDLAGQRFPHDQPDHPADAEPLYRHAVAIAADAGGLWLALAGRLTRVRPLAGQVASVLALADATPAVRLAIERKAGRAAADLGLAVGSAVAQGLAQGPFGLVVDVAHRALLLDEQRARRDLWRQREPELSGAGGLRQPKSRLNTARPVPIPAGPVETYSNTAAAGALVGGIATLIASRDLALTAAATAAAAPKAAKTGREGFAARFGADLSRSGVLTIDTGALRRLDRVDTVVLDAALLYPAGPAPDPLAAALAASARAAGVLVIAGRPGDDQQLRADRLVAGGTSMAASVRALQREGSVVVVVSACQHAALAAADVGIGVAAGPRPPWGADVMTGPDLAGACRVLDAIRPARSVSKRAVMLAGYGTGTGAVLALAGPRPGAAGRSMLAVNAAALAALASGAWSAYTLASRPPPVPAQVTPWHALDPDSVLSALGSGRHGLDQAEAASRRPAGTDGAPDSGPGVLRAAAEELANPLTPVLASGAGLAAAAGSITDAALIGAFMTANALVAGAQRVSVGQALSKLIDESAVRVRLLRPGKGAKDEPNSVLSTGDEIVPGDVIMLRAGDAVPADCRILQASGLETDESSLTGESQLVVKGTAATNAAEVAERRSMLYAGSSVAAGSAVAVAVATGPQTELGRSARAADGQRRPAGVQARLAELTARTIPLTLAAGAGLIGTGLLRGRPVRDTLGTGVSLAVAAVPEGLPIVASAAQYAAARRLSRRNALIRRPGTIEALGRVDVLCFDKTGTLTQGRLRLHRVWVPPSRRDGQAPVPSGGLALGDLTPDARHALAAGLRATPRRRGDEPLAHPTDRAIVAGAKKAGVGPAVGTSRWRPAAELPFEPSRGYHAVLGWARDGQLIAVKGAPETVLPRCGGLSRPARQQIERQASRLALAGYRVLAVAERAATGRDELVDERIGGLAFTGLLALTDPVRQTAADAVAGLRAVGVDVLMLTGDHPSTAQAIAGELGLMNGHRVVTGPQLDQLADQDLDKLVAEAAVFARVSPDHKVRIVAALHRVGKVVAVTGDGANDAPAIRLADVGVALGRRGTSAAKEAADIVVTDDRIETVIDAIVEGRAMWSSVRDAIAMLLGGNLGEIAFTLGTGLLPGGPALNARQLLLINLLTDLVPSLALAVREPTADACELARREGPDASLGEALNRDIVLRGVLTAGAGLAAWAGGRLTGIGRRRAGTIALTGIVGAQLGQTLVVGWRSPLVAVASAGSAVALAMVVQTPVLSQFFGCVPLGPVGWGIGLGSAAAASLAAPFAARLATRP